jgi:hypothetical protein
MSVLIALGAMSALVALVSVLRGWSRELDRRHAQGRCPALYPALDDEALCRIFAAATARELADATRVVVVPLAGADEPSVHAGLAFARLLRRDLCLLHGLSPRDSADTRSTPYESADAVDARERRGQWVVGGNATLSGQRLSLALWGVRDEHRFYFTLEGDIIHTLLSAALQRLARELGTEVQASAAHAIERGHPPSLAALLRLGAVFALAARRIQKGASSHRDLEVEAQALDLLTDFPALSVLGELLGPSRLADLYRLYDQDPHNAGLCFHIYCQLWRGDGYQREAFQFVRRALELCPAHGKANMVAPHAAFEPARMGQHSELAYRLLPDNSFAASNYAGWLARHEKAHEQVIPVARAAIDLSPADPASYERLMDAYEALRDYERAHEVGKELLGWLEPRIHPRTRYCLDQNPVTRARLARGEYDPAANLKTRLARLQTQLRAATSSAAI